MAFARHDSGFDGDEFLPQDRLRQFCRFRQAAEHRVELAFEQSGMGDLVDPDVEFHAQIGKARLQFRDRRGQQRRPKKWAGPETQAPGMPAAQRLHFGLGELALGFDPPRMRQQRLAEGR